MYTLFIISGQDVKQFNDLSKNYAREMAYIALKRNSVVQLLTPCKKYITLTLKDFPEYESGK